MAFRLTSGQLRLRDQVRNVMPPHIAEYASGIATGMGGRKCLPAASRDHSVANAIRSRHDGLRYDRAVPMAGRSGNINWTAQNRGSPIRWAGDPDMITKMENHIRWSSAQPMPRLPRPPSPS
jgi:hypothetical protein